MLRETGSVNTHVYTMRELNRRTADVIKEINESGEPAEITRHGRCVAIITPLADTNVESAALATVPGRVENSSQSTGESTETEVHPGDSVADELGPGVGPHKVRGPAHDGGEPTHQATAPSRPGSEDRLAALGDDADAGVRRAAAAASWGRREHEVTALLAALRNEHHPRVRRAAVRALQGRHEPEIVTALLAALTDADTDGRRTAVGALQGRHEPEVAAALVAALQNDADPRVRRAAATALWGRQEPEVTTALLAALQDDADTNVRGAAENALSRSYVREDGRTPS